MSETSQDNSISATTSALSEPCACCIALAQVTRHVCQAQETMTPPAENHGSRGGKQALITRLPGFNLRGKEKSKQSNPSLTKSLPKEVSSQHNTDNTGCSTLDEWDDDLIPKPNKQKLWHGWDGLGVMTFGVLAPGVILLLGCLSAPKRLTLVLLNHPLEMTAEMLLVFSIPLINYLAWSAVCKNSIVFSKVRGIALGATVGTSLLLACICIAGVLFAYKELALEIGTAFSTGFCSIGALAALAAVAGAYLANRVRLTREFPRSRARVVFYTVLGLALSMLTFVGAEYRPWCIRIAERMSNSSSPQERQQGLTWLRQLKPERELRMECSDARAAGLSGLFIPLKSTTQHQLYFAVTGRPYSFRDSNNTDLSTMPDDYISRHVVGDKIESLSLARSSMTGAVHPDTLSSTVNWTLVFRNVSAGPQEARAEIKVPQGAVITGLTLWTNGEPQDGLFAASGKIEGADNWIEANHTSPAIVTDLGHGRALLHCYPVPQEEELKVNVTMVVPLKPDRSKTASLPLPRFIATNFDLSGEHRLRLRSTMPLTSNLTDLKPSSNTAGQKLLAGTLHKLDSHDLMVTVQTPTALPPIAVLDELAAKLCAQEKEREEEEGSKRQQAANTTQAAHVTVVLDGSKGIERQLADVNKALAADRQTQKPQKETAQSRYVIQSVKQIAAQSPKHLVVVVDGSSSMSPYAKELAAILAKLPDNIRASVIVASQEDDKLMEPLAISQGLKNLHNVAFVGGQDNLHSVVKAAELAGESPGGAVLWIHGPQPVLNREIYIMAPYVARPYFHEVVLDSGDTDTYEFFKNHSEIGPFEQVPRNSSLSTDLEYFFSKWKPDSNDYVVSRSEAVATPGKLRTTSEESARELIMLHANEKCLQLIANRQGRKAARLAMAYGIVTPVSSALVLERTATASWSSSNERDETQQYGATNGTIGPQAGDATVVQGVNTAGTVRVNNLANVEALFNIIANLLEVGCALTGAVTLLHGLANKEMVTKWMGMPVELSSGKRITIGVALILVGLAVPGIINWFVAAARDANLFS